MTGDLPGQADNGSHFMRLATGDIQLRPLNQDLTLLSELGDPYNAVVRMSQWQVCAAAYEKPTWHLPSDIGPGQSGGVVTAGDYFIDRHYSITPWTNGSLTADAATFPDPAFPTVNIPVDRVGVGPVFDANTGYMVRLNTQWSHLHGADTVLAFFFGGALDSRGRGQFCLHLNAAGRAKLYETDYDVSQQMTAAAWTLRASWQWATPNEVDSKGIVLQILPVAGPRPFIQFTAGVGAMGALFQSRRSLTLANGASAPTTFVYRCSTYPAGYTNATGAGHIRVDQRRDERLPFQVSRLCYPLSQSLTDSPFMVSHALTTDRTWRVVWRAHCPDGTSVSARLMDPTTGSQLTQVSADANGLVFATNPGKPSAYLVYDFGATRFASPVLYGASVIRDGSIEALAPGEYVAGPTGNALRTAVERVSITGGDRDPSVETASLQVVDMVGDLSRLSVRGETTIRIETTYDAADPTKRSCLFAGRLQGPERRPFPPRQDHSPSDVYPSPYWARYVGQACGMWSRLEESRIGFSVNVSVDPSDPQGRPYKATDIVRAAFGWAGYSDSEIDVPDLDVRMYAALNDDALIYDAATSVMQVLADIVYQHLGGYIIYDPNAGATGMWRMMLNKRAPYTPLWQFLTVNPHVAGKDPLFPGALGAQVSPILTYHGKPSLRTRTIRPRANFVLVSTTTDVTPTFDGRNQTQNWMANPKSFDCFADAQGHAIHSADPTSPDYIGHIVPIYIVNTSLAGADAATSANAVNVTLRRAYETHCFAKQMAWFVAPLALVTDTSDTHQTQPRPLRYYDPVLIDSDVWLVRSCNPDYERDGFQYALYECEKPRF